MTEIDSSDQTNPINRKNKLPLKWIVIFDIVCLTLGVLGGAISLYDLTHLKQIEHRCLDNCNTHWVNEIQKLQGYSTDSLFDNSNMNYTYIMPGGRFGT
jgi:hypothetical protein